MTQTIKSIDAETDGLFGKPFSIAVIVYKNKIEVDKICFRLPNSVVKNEWVKENVLATLNFPVTHDKYEDMLKDFAKFYMKHKEAETLWHMGHIVEVFLFRECVRLGFLGEFETPYNPIEVAEMLRIKGFQPDSVDLYIDIHGLTIKDYGSTHNPLYDCEVAAKTYFHLTNN